MSRLWTESGVSACLTDDSVTLLRVRGGLRPVVTDAGREAFTAGEWSLALAALAKGLEMAPAPASVRVLLGARWVRYLLLPWSPELARHGFREALAAALFERQFQQPVGAYRVQLGACAYGQPLLAAFVAREAELSLVDLLQSRGLRLTSLQPLLAAIWNRHHAVLRRQPGTLLVQESGRLLCVGHAGGHVQSVALRPGTPVDLPALCAVLEGSVQVAGANSTRLPPEVLRLQGRALRHTTAVAPDRHDLALYGVA